ncbi:MAG: carbon monoxide dehydrogenase [Oscillospiraceae bacterium]|nr:carbon monoxide dehydrogenase [Oscillospiraceae bacterium]
MDLFNPLIGNTRDLLAPKNATAWPYSPSDCWRDLGSNELVLQRDAAYELGARGKGSANYVLFTSSPELVPEDRVVLYGRDLREIGADCDFARIVLLRVGMIDGDDETVYRTLKEIEYAKYHVFPEGYMVRISPESFREQVRVSKQAMARGISFRALGNSYIREYKKDPNVLAAEVIFITDPSVDYVSLQDLAKKSTAAIGTLTHILEGLPTDCSVCSLKDICDEVEGMKELHFGVGSKGTHE